MIGRMMMATVVRMTEMGMGMKMRMRLRPVS